MLKIEFLMICIPYKYHTVNFYCSISPETDQWNKQNEKYIGMIEIGLAFNFEHISII